MNINFIKLETGASSTKVIMPAHGASVLDLEAGAASINIIIPPGVSARINAEGGMTSLNVDTNRFPQVNSRVYESPDYESAENRAEIKVETGVGSITVK